MAAKYGHALTDSDWVGLPLRVGTFESEGRLEHLTSPHDAVLVWTGGVVDVTINCVSGPGGTGSTRHQFVRHSGNLDLLPRGTTFRDVTWTGESQTCVAVALPRGCMAQLLGDGDVGLDVERGPRFNLVDAHVVDLVERLVAQASQADPLGATYVQSLSLALASYVTSRFGKGERPESRAGLPDLPLAKIFAFIEDHLEHNLGLVDLANVAGYSPDHFARQFKQNVGSSPHKYLQARRVERAKTMLRDRELSIVQVAHACGFANQAHFSTVFKQHTGMTPGTYRKG